MECKITVGIPGVQSVDGDEKEVWVWAGGCGWGGKGVHPFRRV
jgi:hypothetical protein